jgi:HSP20 family protein
MMTDLMRWNPFDELRRFADEFERRLGSWSRPFSFGFSAPSYDASSSMDGRRVRIALPGIAPENVEVSVAGRSVHVRAAEKHGDTEVTHYEELFTVPESIDTDKISASFRHGMLELMLPYKEAVKPRRIEISVDGQKQLPQAA